MDSSSKGAGVLGTDETFSPSLVMDATWRAQRMLTVHSRLLIMARGGDIHQDLLFSAVEANDGVVSRKGRRRVATAIEISTRGTTTDILTPILRSEIRLTGLLLSLIEQTDAWRVRKNGRLVWIGTPTIDEFILPRVERIVEAMPPETRRLLDMT